MRNAIIILFIILVITFATGFYIRGTGDVPTGDKVIGLTILVAVFVLMPMFLYHRWKDRKVKDYMLNEENIKRMRDYNDSKKSGNQ
ncbi:MAG: hypothetical protein WBG71_07355 [Leeuwenhoekiella sp.]